MFETINKLVFFVLGIFILSCVCYLLVCSILLLCAVEECAYSDSASLTSFPLVFLSFEIIKWRRSSYLWCEKFSACWCENRELKIAKRNSNVPLFWIHTTMSIVAPFARDRVPHSFLFFPLYTFIQLLSIYCVTFSYSVSQHARENVTLKYLEEETITDNFLCSSYERSFTESYDFDLDTEMCNCKKRT